MKKQFVSSKDESVRMFDNNFLDFFSRVHFSIPLLIYVPTILYFSYLSFFVYNVSLLLGLVLIFLGILLWSFTEYTMHRFVFHFEPKNAIGKRIHFMFHGVHHDYPNDSLRLVMPPAVSIPLAALFYYLFVWLIGSTAIACTLFIGFMVGYLCYDMMHYAVHHAKIQHPLFKKLKKHHMVHHFKDSENGFGVSSVLWDYIFGTRYKS